MYLISDDLYFVLPLNKIRVNLTTFFFFSVDIDHTHAAEGHLANQYNIHYQCLVNLFL